MLAASLSGGVGNQVFPQLRYKPTGSLWGWLYTRARWRGIEYLRRANRDWVLVALVQSDKTNGDDYSLLDFLADIGELPDDVVGGVREREDKEDCIRKLPDLERRVLLSRRAGRRVVEIAAEEGIGVGAVPTIEQRAWRKVHRGMREKGHNYPYVYPRNLDFTFQNGSLLRNDKPLTIDSEPQDGWSAKSGCEGQDFDKAPWLSWFQDEQGEVRVHVDCEGLTAGEYFGAIWVKFPPDSWRIVKVSLKVKENKQ